MQTYKRDIRAVCKAHGLPMAADTAMSADRVTIIIPNTFIFCSASCFYCIAAQITLVAS